MIKLKDVTLIAPTGNNIDTTIKAMLYSIKDIEFGAVKLITHEKPKNLVNRIEFSECLKMDSY